MNAVHSSFFSPIAVAIISYRFISSVFFNHCAMRNRQVCRGKLVKFT